MRWGDRRERNVRHIVCEKNVQGRKEGSESVKEEREARGSRRKMYAPPDLISTRAAPAARV